MTEVKTITTQEEFDKALADRVKKITKAYEKKIKDLKDNAASADTTKTTNEKLKSELEAVKEKVANFDKEKETLNNIIKGHEVQFAKVKIALEAGLPHNVAERLSGNDEEEIRADAETLLEIMGTQTTEPPLKNTEDENADDRTNAYRELLNGIKGE